MNVMNLMVHLACAESMHNVQTLMEHLIASVHPVFQEIRSSNVSISTSVRVQIPVVKMQFVKIHRDHLLAFVQKEQSQTQIQVFDVLQSFLATLMTIVLEMRFATRTNAVFVQSQTLEMIAVIHAKT